jgi:hypothetical protein
MHMDIWERRVRLAQVALIEVNIAHLNTFNRSDRDREEARKIKAKSRVDLMILLTKLLSRDNEALRWASGLTRVSKGPR